jgi:LmbE family N-acetylglucosaminyl deacetylase
MKGFEAFDEVRRAIVVAAHPDDLECCCGGLISMLVERGAEVFSVNCTLGDIGAQEGDILRPALAANRLRETEDAARLLRLAGTYNLGRHDGELLADLELRGQLARLYRVTQADTLLTFDPHWPGQIHPDHRAAGQAALDAYMPAKMPLYRPEQLYEPGAALCKLQRIFLFSTERDVDVCVDVTGVYPDKMAACMAHGSQFPKGVESLKWLQEMDGRAGQHIGVQYAEAYRTMLVW